MQSHLILAAFILNSFLDTRITLSSMLSDLLRFICRCFKK